MAKVIEVVSEEEQFKYNLSSDSLSKVEGNNNPGKVLILDDMFDLKVIEIPVVNKNLIASIVYNTIKRHSSISENIKNIDYRIILNDDDKYKIAVFISHNDIDEFENQKKVLLFNVLQNIISKNEELNNCKVLIEINETYFLYSYTDGIFIKRQIYYEEDISKLKDTGIYYIKFESYGIVTSRPGFDDIGESNIAKALYKINDYVFYDNSFQWVKPLLVTTFVVLFVLSVAGTFLNNSLKSIGGTLTLEKSKLEETLEGIIDGRGISKKEYEKIIKTLGEGSKVKMFFINLYSVSKDNVRIKTLSFDNDLFIISGTCRSDLQLEEAFRDHILFENVNTDFKPEKGVIRFRVSGRFKYER